MQNQNIFRFKFIEDDKPAHGETSQASPKL